jgi:hypothetical protein
MKMFSFVRKWFAKSEEKMELQTVDPKIALETAEQELAGAQQRLDLAHRALRRFEAEHCAVIDGASAYVTADPAVRHSLDRERHALLIEIDESTRRWQKALADRNALLPPRTSIGAGKKLEAKCTD